MAEDGVALRQDLAVKLDDLGRLAYPAQSSVFILIIMSSSYHSFPRPQFSVTLSFSFSFSPLFTPPRNSSYAFSFSLFPPHLEVTYRDFTGGIQFRNLRLLVLRVLIESIAHVCIRDTGVFPHKPKHLPAATRFEVEVVYCGHAADLFIGSAGLTEGVGGGHF